MIKVSVIIPVYNAEKYLKECLDSLVNQTLNEIEFICINDGSTDNSLQILEEYACKNDKIKVFTTSNRGLSAARNFGISKASGAYIGFVDSDDYIDPDYFEKLYNAAQKHNADIAMASVYRIRKKRNRYFLKLTKEKVYNTTEEKYKVANLPQSCYVWNKIFKTSSYLNSNIEFKEGMVYEDIEFNHKALHLLAELVTVPGTKYYYRDNPYSVVNINKAEDCEDYKYAMKSAINYILNNKINYDLFRYPPVRKYKTKLFGIPVLRVKEWEYGKRVYLFGIFPIIKRRFE